MIKPLSHASDPLRVLLPGAADSGFFIAPTTITAHPVGDPYGRGWGIAGTVGKPEKPAGVAKIVPQAKDCRAMRGSIQQHTYEGLSLSLGRARLSFTTSRGLYE